LATFVLFDLTREHFADLNERSSHSEILGKFNSLYLGHNRAEGSTQQAAAKAFQRTIVREFIDEEDSIKSRAKEHGFEASLISNGFAKRRHGELDEQTGQSDELTYYKGRVSALEREVDELKGLVKT